MEPSQYRIGRHRRPAISSRVTRIAGRRFLPIRYCDGSICRSCHSLGRSSPCSTESQSARRAGRLRFPLSTGFRGPIGHPAADRSGAWTSFAADGDVEDVEDGPDDQICRQETRDNSEGQPAFTTTHERYPPGL